MRLCKKIFSGVNPSEEHGINFAPEYTGCVKTVLKFFTRYKHLMLKDEQGVPTLYTLMLAMSSKNVLALLNGQQNYEGQSTALTDRMGNYIVSSKNYKSLISSGICMSTTSLRWMRGTLSGRKWKETERASRISKTPEGSWRIAFSDMKKWEWAIGIASFVRPRHPSKRPHSTYHRNDCGHICGKCGGGARRV